MQDPCFIVNDTDNEPYELGRARDIFIKWPNSLVMPEEDFNATYSTAMLGYVSNVTDLQIDPPPVEIMQQKYETLHALHRVEPSFQIFGDRGKIGTAKRTLRPLEMIESRHAAYISCTFVH